MADGKPWPEKAIKQKTVEDLHALMLELWGKPYVDKWAGVPVDSLFRTWGRTLYGITELEFRRGVNKLKELDRPPSAPEFLKACKPEIKPMNAYYEAIEGLTSRERGEAGTWSHPAIFWASVRVSASDMLNQTYSQIRVRWEAALEAELEKGKWEEIPTPKLALPSPAIDQRSRQEAAKMMQTIKETVLTPKADPKAWAKKIMERHKAGDKSLLLIQVQFAKQALHMEDKGNA